MIHVAVMHLTEPSPEGETEQVYVSLDGEKYLPVNRRPEAGDEDAIAPLFEHQKLDDGRLFLQMTYARRAMNQWFWGDQVKSFDHYEVQNVS